MSRAIPGPRGSLLFGSLAEFRDGMLSFFDRCRRDYGPIVAFRLGTRRIILVCEPSLIEDVLVTQNKSFRKHYASRLLKPVLGNGILLSEGDMWLRQRRLIQPSFSRKFFQDFATIVSGKAASLAGEWRANPHRDLYRDMTKLTVQIAAHAFLGVNEAGDVDEIDDCLERIHADYEHRFQRPWNAPFRIPARRNRQLGDAVKRLTAMIDRMIASRRNSNSNERHDVLSLLMRATDDAGSRMPMQLLRDEVMTMLLAGHDTTANALTWTWTLLAQHATEMQQVREEAVAHFTDSSGAPRDLDRLSHAGRTIRESMRLFPPVYMFGREARHAVKIGEHLVPKGTSIVMPQWVVHRDARYYDEPLSFEPSRWSADFERSLPRYAYFPFGGGPRVCIGREVALIEATIVVAQLAAEFAITLDNPGDIKPWPTVTLRPRGPVWATVGSPIAVDCVGQEAYSTRRPMPGEIA